MNTFDIKNLIANAPSDMLDFKETSVLKEAAFFGDLNGNNIRPSIDRLAKQVKLSTRTVKRALKSLVAKGFLIVIHKPRRGCWRPVQYKLNITLLEKVSIVTEYVTPIYQYINQGQYDTAYNYRCDKLSSSSDKTANIQCQDGTQSTNISTNDLPNINVELASNSTIVSEQSSVILEAEPMKSAPEPELEQDQIPLAATSTNQSKTKPNENYKTPVVASIFAHWQTMLNHPRAKLDANRRRCIVNALKFGFSEAELKKAIDGLSKTPHNMGQNDRGEIYDGLHIVFRNSEQIERFMRNADNPPTTKPKHSNIGQKKTFVQKNQEQVEMMREITEKYYPKFSKYFPSHNLTQTQYAPTQLRQEVLVNGN